MTGPSLTDIVFHFVGGHYRNITLYDNDINPDAILYLTNQVFTQPSVPRFQPGARNPEK